MFAVTSPQLKTPESRCSYAASETTHGAHKLAALTTACVSQCALCMHNAPNWKRLCGRESHILCSTLESAQDGTTIFAKGLTMFLHWSQTAAVPRHHNKKNNY